MKSILIVDDEPLIRWSVGQTLAARGHSVVEAESAREALQRFLERDDIGVVLLDLKLPDSNDLTLLRRLRAHTPTPRIILMTAHGTAEILDEAIRAGAFRTISKPFDVDDVADIVHDAVALD